MKEKPKKKICFQCEKEKNIEKEFSYHYRVCKSCVIKNAKERKSGRQAYPSGCYDPRAFRDDKMFI